ncbi:hypothetical protein ABEB36_013827 [Hypothenemus hampei]|uniref:Uncharacterized protein n=1 Tax=Hypothenemus hampei TaxID=57062 RepID=A0ABD1E5P5_HYPHA
MSASESNDSNKDYNNNVFSSCSSEIYEPDSSDDSSDPDLPGPSVKRRHKKKTKPSESANEHSTLTKISKKNRKSVNSANWKRNLKKKAIAEGKNYINWHGVPIGPRKTGPDCRFKYKCFEKLGEDRRKAILENFNKIGDRYMQNIYLGLVTTYKVHRIRVKSGERKSRSCSHKYHIRLGKEANVRVCRAAFVSV